jgi:acyl carrier protein
MAASDAIAPRVRELLAQVTGVPVSEVGPGFSQETAPAWTSLVHLMLVSQIEQEFAVTLTNDEIRELTSFERIVDRLSRQAGAA